MFFECRCAVCDSGPGPVCEPCAGQLRPGPTVGDIRARFVLDDASRPIVAGLKYRRERRMARWVAASIGPLVPALVDAVAWVPATPERVAWRGYDQSREIARELARQIQAPARQLLVRHRGDERQTSRTRQERSRGPQLRPRGRADGFVLLVDDVVTTGATMATARAVLEASGTSNVVSVVFAATPRWDQGQMQPAEHSSTIRSWKSKSAPNAPKSLHASRST